MKKYLFLSVLLSLAYLTSSIMIIAQDDKIQVITTTTIIADVAQNVGGERVTVTSLIPPDSDVHAFQPSPVDVARIAEADLLLVNGAGLESFLEPLLANAGDVEVVVVSNGVEMLPFGQHDHETETDQHTHNHDEDKHLGKLGFDVTCNLANEHETDAHTEDEHEHGACDPHVWTDPRNVMVWANNIAAALSIADPAGASVYLANAEAYKMQLEALDETVAEILSVIPQDRRIMVTNHEFLGYFAHRYEFAIVGIVIPGGTTLAEPNPQELATLIDTIRAENVSAIFAEVSDPGTLSNVIAAEVGDTVELVSLYSEALSDINGPASTYIDYLRYNATTITNALAP